MKNISKSLVSRWGSVSIAVILGVCGCEKRPIPPSIVLPATPFDDINALYYHLYNAAAEIYIDTPGLRGGLVGSGVVVSKTVGDNRLYGLLTCYHVATNITLNPSITHFKLGVLSNRPEIFRRIEIDKSKLQWATNGWDRHDMALSDLTDVSLDGAEIHAIDLDCKGYLSTTNTPQILSYAGVAVTNCYDLLRIKHPFSYFVAIGAVEAKSIKMRSKLGIQTIIQTPFRHLGGNLLAMFVDKPVSTSSQSHAQDHHIVHCFRHVSNPGNSGGGVYVVTEEYEPYLIGILRSGNPVDWTSSVLPIDHVYTLFDELYDSNKKETPRNDSSTKQS